MASIGYLGVDIGGTNTKLAVMDGRGRILKRDSVKTAVDDGPAGAFERIGGRLASLLGARKLRAVGVGCAGLIDPRSGRILASPNLQRWVGESIIAAVKRTLGVPAVADNDVNAAAYGEYRHGCGRGATTFVCLTLGTGVGGAIVDRGAVLRGAGNFAGEIGHMTLNEKGPRCKCGNKGCLEAYVGTAGLVRHARRLMARRPDTRLHTAWRSRELTPKAIIEAARRGDKTSCEVVDAAAMHLGVALASLVNVLNPDVIGIGGAIAGGGFDLMRSRVHDEVSARAFDESVRLVTITPTRLGNHAAAIGAAVMAMEMGPSGSPRLRAKA